MLATAQRRPHSPTVGGIVAMQTLGLAVITKNEEDSIERCLRSVPFADQVVVVDSGSTDRTAVVAERCGAHVIQRAWPGFPKQKQFAMDQLQTEWILVLDADEWLTDAAQEEIRSILRRDPTSGAADAYRIPVYHVFLGRELRHGMWVDSKIRLVHSGKGRYNDREVHESILVDGRVAEMSSGILHETSPMIAERLEKIQRDTELEMLYRSAPPPGVRRIFVNPIRFFLSFMFRRGGWRDGMEGAICTALFAFQIFYIEARFYEAALKDPR
jgi:glycosyltransferase involved in cell wall biosynthesis